MMDKAQSAVFRLPEHRAFFITGTDTGVGKTFCTVALLRALQQSGYTAVGYKPIASEADEAGENDDVRALQAASSARLPYGSHNVYTFIEATAPHLAAEDERKTIDWDSMSSGLERLKQQADCALIEGAGGWLTPLDRQRTFADWAVREQLPVVLVVGMKLGAINHALLTAQSVRVHGLSLAGWVANCLEEKPHRLRDYVDTLSEMLPAPLLGVVPFRASVAQAAEVLDVGRLLSSVD